MGIDTRIRADGSTAYRVRKRTPGGDIRETFDTLEEAERYLLDLNQRIRSGRYRTPDATTVAECVRQHIDRHRKRWEQRTTTIHEGTLRLHVIGSPLATVSLANLTLPMVQAWVDGLDLSPSSCRVAGAVVSGALRDAVRQGIIPANPASGVVYPASQRHTVRPWSRSEIRAVYATVQDDARLHAVYRLFLMLGLRSGELRALDWADLRGDRLHIHRTVAGVGKATRIREGTKAGAGRVVVVPTPVLDALDTWGRGAGLIFPNQGGGYLDSATLRYWHERTCDRAGVPRIRLHDLRHTAATSMLDAGVPLKVVSEILGHASTRITADLYLHVDDDMQRRAMDRLDRWVDDTSTT